MSTGSLIFTITHHPSTISSLLFQLLPNQFGAISSGQQHRAEGGAHSWGPIHGGDSQSDDEAIGINFSGTIHPFFLRSGDPHGTVSRNLIIQVPFVKKFDQHGIVAGGIDHDLALKSD